MLTNFLKTAFRNIWKNKVFSLINIIGLAVGMAACMLIVKYVSFESSYDSYHEKGNRIYRVLTDIRTPTETINAGITSAPMGPYLKADFPDIEAFARIYSGGMLLQNQDRKFQEDNVLFADSTLFSVFSFPLMHGNPSAALSGPFKIVLSETAAKKYFGNENPVGKQLLMEGKYNGLVTGVMKDIPANSNFRSDILISMSTLTQRLVPGIENWGNFGWYTYLLLPPGYNFQKLQAKLPDFMQRHVGEFMKQNKMYYTLSLQPLKDVYFDVKRGSLENGSKTNIYIFSVIAVFILLIACINFINLTTARSSDRAREVGIRKVVGAARNQLGAQFIGESLLVCVVAFLVAVVIAVFCLPPFNQLAGKTVSEGIFENTGQLAALFLIGLAIGVLSGIYPAMVLSGFKPIAVLKGRFRSSNKGVGLRKFLVVVQFAISIALIISTIVVYRQLNFMRSQELGFRKDQIVTIDFKGDENVHKNIETIRNEMLRVPNVLSASFSSGLPGGGTQGAFTEIQNKSGDMQGANLDMYSVDYNFIPLYQLKMVAGRAFSTSFATDSTKALIVNEAAVKSFGYNSPEEIIGKRFSQWGREGTVIGVIKDFHFRSLQTAIKPLVLRVFPENSDFLALNIASGNLPATLAAIENKWKELAPQRPFNYTFLDDTFNRQYLSEVRFGHLFLYFAILAIFISCLGLLGLASYSTTQRVREIGIRKVLGASIAGIVQMLSVDFLKLICIAALIAYPVAWYSMNSWLENFAYRQEFSWSIFAIAALIAIATAVMTISFQAFKAAVANPVKSLRTE